MALTIQQLEHISYWMECNQFGPTGVCPVCSGNHVVGHEADCEDKALMTCIRDEIESLKKHPKQMTDFGWANSWGEDPLIVKKCQELKHEAPESRIGSFEHEVRCDICRYVYRYDSS